MSRVRLRERVLLLAGLVVLVGVGVWLVAENDASSTETEPIDAAGPFDGLESRQLPIEVTPNRDLIDEQTVEVVGSGFTPGATIAMVQCWLSENGGSRDDCDLGNIAVAYADEQGAFREDMMVHQLIDTENGVLDCAAGTATAGCRIGVGNTLDLDESGGAAISFAAADAVAPPTIEATPNTGLRDGDPIAVSGMGFEAGSQVTVTQCPVGGLDDASWGCVSRNPGEVVDIDTAGAFSMTVAAARQRVSEDGPHDCALEVYACMLVVRTVTPPIAIDCGNQVDDCDLPDPSPPLRSPNPVPLDFDPGDAPVLPPEYTVSPSQGLENGSVVRLDVFDMPIDGSFGVRQCADGGPRGLFCEPRGVLDVVDGDGTVDIIVVTTLTNADDSIDCSVPARRCYLTLDGELAEIVRGPLRFGS